MDNVIKGVVYTSSGVYYGTIVNNKELPFQGIWVYDFVIIQQNPDNGAVIIHKGLFPAERIFCDKFNIILSRDMDKKYLEALEKNVEAYLIKNRSGIVLAGPGNGRQ